MGTGRAQHSPTSQASAPPSRPGPFHPRLTRIGATGQVIHWEEMANSGSIEIQMPQMGESVTEGTVLEWHKQEGEFVEEGETVVEVSTDKVDAEVPAPTSGTLTKIHAQADETVQVGQLLAEMSVGEAPSGDPEQADGGSRTAEAAQRVAGVESAPEQADGRRISPVARRIAAASGVDLSAVTGSGAGGKITKADVLALADGRGATAPPAAPASGEAKPLRGPAAMLAKAMNEI